MGEGGHETEVWLFNIEKSRGAHATLSSSKKKGKFQNSNDFVNGFTRMAQMRIKNGNSTDLRKSCTHESWVDIFFLSILWTKGWKPLKCSQCYS